MVCIDAQVVSDTVFGMVLEIKNCIQLEIWTRDRDVISERWLTYEPGTGAEFDGTSVLDTNIM